MARTLADMYTGVCEGITVISVCIPILKDSDCIHACHESHDILCTADPLSLHARTQKPTLVDRPSFVRPSMGPETNFK